MSYTIQFTDKRKTPIIVDDTEIDNSTDITLFGRSRLSYGENLQENLLHILENFSCPENPANPGNPDLSHASGTTFQNITTGQGWYNTTTEVLNYYNGTKWVPLAPEQSIASNWGTIADGQNIPLPISSVTGRTFTYANCVYIVTPQSIPARIDYLACSASATGVVTMKYRIAGTSTILSGVANYIIVAIASNVNQPSPPIVVSPTPTPSPTTSLKQSATPTPTMTQSLTPAVSSTPGASPTPQPTPQPSITRTPVASPTPQPSNTPSPSVAAPTPLPINGSSIYAYAGGSGRCPGNTAVASISFVFNSNGTYTVTPQSFPGTNCSASSAGTWLPPSWTVADSQIMFTPNFSTTDDGPASVTNNAPTFTSLTTTQGFGITASVGCGVGRGKGSGGPLTISLRRISTGVVVNTTVTVNCDVASGD